MRPIHSIFALIPPLGVHVVLLFLSATIARARRQDLPVVPAGHAEPEPSASAGHELAHFVPALERRKRGLESQRPSTKSNDDKDLPLA